MSCLALIGRDVRLASRGGGSTLLALAFFAAIVTLVPLGIGPRPGLLHAVAGGIIMLCATLAALLSLDHLFQADFDDGSLELLATGPLSLESLAVSKIVAHWLATGLPLLAISPLAAFAMELPGNGLFALLQSVALATPAVSAMGAIGASLTLAAKRGGLILPLIVLPLLTPVVIFGAGIVRSAMEGMANGAALYLGAYSLAAVLLSPFAVAAGLRTNLSA
ncbi:MAG TPA: heme exporter protein CcmB [Rhizomicrobium sp.]|jgi:heme exporter protein B|nr:heme exporter protein CcmB [Rhizomicrobium sp.]